MQKIFCIKKGYNPNLCGPTKLLESIKKHVKNCNLKLTIYIEYPRYFTSKVLFYP